MWSPRSVFGFNTNIRDLRHDHDFSFISYGALHVDINPLPSCSCRISVTQTNRSIRNLHFLQPYDVSAICESSTFVYECIFFNGLLRLIRSKSSWCSIPDYRPLINFIDQSGIVYCKHFDKYLTHIRTQAPELCISLKSHKLLCNKFSENSKSSWAREGAGKRPAEQQTIFRGVAKW